jgi:hypothetical protein
MVPRLVNLSHNLIADECHILVLVFGNTFSSIPALPYGVVAVGLNELAILQLLNPKPIFNQLPGNMAETRGGFGRGRGGPRGRRGARRGPKKDEEKEW